MIFGKYNFYVEAIGLSPQADRKNLIGRVIVSVSFLSLISMMSVFLILNLRRDFDQTFLMVPTYFAYGANIAVYFLLLLNRKHFFSLWRRLEDVVRERTTKDKMNKIIYEKAATQINFAMKVLVISIWSNVMMHLSPFILVFYEWCLRKYTIDSWFFYVPIWTPFELNTAARCAFVVLFEALAVACIAFVCGTFMCLLIGSILYVEMCLLDVKLILDLDPLTLKEATYSELIEYVKEALDLHTRVIRCMQKLSDVTNTIIFVMVIPMTMPACLCLSVIARYSGADFLSDFQMPILSGIFCLNVLLIFSYTGQRIHSSADELGGLIYQTYWYLYPPRIQRYLQLMILRTQRPFYLSAHGIMKMTLGNYVELLRWTYSVFMLLRKME